MARFTAQVNAGENVNVPMKVNSAVTDNDVGKPVAIHSSDTVDLCSDGDQIYGFIDSIMPATADGNVMASIQISGRRKVYLAGAAAVGTFVEAAANTAAGTAPADEFGEVSAHTVVTGTVKFWQVISGTGLDNSVALIEKQ